MIRSTLASFLCMAIAASAAPAPTAPAPKVRPAPNFVIKLPNASGQITPAQYKGKVVVVAMILTTCPHCQNATVMLSRLQKEYGPRGLQILAAAFNPDAERAVPDFIRTYKPTFPVGYAGRNEVLTFLGQSPDFEMYVPIMSFIDRKGMIRYSHLGDDKFFADPERGVRAHIEDLLGKPAVVKKAAPAVTKNEGPKIVLTPEK